MTSENRHLRILGVVLAGGQSSRFGSDKALAELDGRPLLALAVEALAQWCDMVVVCGREYGPAPCIPDWPAAGMGPLAGLAAGLRYAVDEGFDCVLSCGVDSPGLPADLPEILGPAPACLASQPVIGIWLPQSAQAAERILTGDGRHSMRALAEACGARLVDLPAPLPNVNYREDLDRL